MLRKIVLISYKTLRTLAMTAIVLAVGLLAVLYVGLSIQPVQERIKQESEEALSDFLKTNVTIDHISIVPFNHVTLYGVNVPDQQNNKLLEIDKLGAGISVTRLLSSGEIEVTYAELIGLHGHVTRPSQDEPTNMQFIIDALKPKGNNPPKKFDLQVRNIVIRSSDLSYDVLDQPAQSGRFDPNHIAVDKLRADVDLPLLKNDNFVIDVKRMSLREKGGLNVKNLSAKVVLEPTGAQVHNVQLELPGTVLRPNDMAVAYDSLKHIGTAIATSKLHLQLDNNRVNLADFACFAPALAKLNQSMLVSLTADGDASQLKLGNVEVQTLDNELYVKLKGRLHNLRDVNQLKFDFPVIDVHASASEIEKLISAFARLKPNVHKIVSNLGDVAVKGWARGDRQELTTNIDLNSSLGALDLQGTVAVAPGLVDVQSQIATQGFDVGRLIDKQKLIGEVAINADVDATVRGSKLVAGMVDGMISHIDLNGYRYQNIIADVKGSQDRIGGFLSMNDANGQFAAEGELLLNGVKSQLEAQLLVSDLNLSKMSIVPNGKGGVVTGRATASLTGNSLNNVTGMVDLDGLRYTAPNGKRYALNHLSLNSLAGDDSQQVDLTSDFVKAQILGTIDYNTLVPALKQIVANAFPNAFGMWANERAANSRNNFDFDVTIDPNESFNSMVKLPVKPLTPVTLRGSLDAVAGECSIALDAPYIQQGNNLIEGSSLTAQVTGTADPITLKLQTLVPSKNGKIALMLNALGVNNNLDADISWRYDRAADYHGTLSTSTQLDRDAAGLNALVQLNPSEIVANDTVWNVFNGSVSASKDLIEAIGIRAGRDRQSISIDGRVSKDPTDTLQLALQNIDLDYIFETLNINNVDFGGRATGTFYASNLFSKHPALLTPNLHVDGLRYNKALMGDADIASHWTDDNAVALDAQISQPNGEKSKIAGAIYPGLDSLYFDFNASRANVEFMKPFMAAFTSDVKGLVSGHAVLFGNFHTIDLYGDIYGEDLRFKLDFSNVYYSASDSVHMTPGRITFDDVTIRDRDNNTAKLSGWLTHEQFHNPVFKFSVTDAKNLLCYDTNASNSPNPNWYGTIYGNGAAFIDGAPGIVNVNVNMASTPGSKFTFILSDAEVADEYTFITYRDRDHLDGPVEVKDPEIEKLPEVVRQFKQRVAENQADQPTRYVIDLQGDITPDLNMTLVMDPVGGDKIRATGRGSLRMQYNNIDDQLEMYGRYVLDKGDYNFTLQDIIIRDFTINQGSTIAFQGDPYAAVLNLEAIYSLNANISDLDESFSRDRDLNRTNVPVHAVLKANGVISEPEISFDLEFPTLTTEAYRKIMSIISTDDMMSRQIVYLLALNRFYTPEYMGSQSSGGELGSVASSTISSQLSSMLGQLSDKWSISPNFRSSKGDFSDVEVDLALSSQLLNNRLLFNGNFGYRDNTYNTRNSNFIGDFDIEYLLNRQGTIRLKAYNHFNDQNYYIRNAMTTQGVGVVFKHDFDSLKPWWRKKKKAVAAPSDSIVTDTTTLAK